MALDACRIKRCDNLYSGNETLIRFINYFRRHHWPYARFSSRMCTCTGYPKTHCFVFFMIFVDVLLMPWTIAIEYCFPLHSEDRNDRDQIEHMLALILAMDVWWSWLLISLNISPPPPPPKKKSPWEHLIISTFEVPSTHCGKKFDLEAQTVCIGYQRWHKHVLWMLTCALPGIKFENPCLVFLMLYNIKWAISFKGGRWKIILKDGKCGLSFPP